MCLGVSIWDTVHLVQDVFNLYFLSLSHQILSSKAWIFSASSGRRATDGATGGHSVPFRHRPCCGDSVVVFLLTILLS